MSCVATEYRTTLAGSMPSIAYEPSDKERRCGLVVLTDAPIGWSATSPGRLSISATDADAGDAPRRASAWLPRWNGSVVGIASHDTVTTGWNGPSSAEGDCTPWLTAVTAAGVAGGRLVLTPPSSSAAHFTSLPRALTNVAVTMELTCWDKLVVDTFVSAPATCSPRIMAS